MRAGSRAGAEAGAGAGSGAGSDADSVSGSGSGSAGSGSGDDAVLSVIIAANPTQQLLFQGGRKGGEVGKVARSR